LHISVVSVGKLKENYLKMGIEEYAKRLSPYAKLQLIEVSDEKAPENLSPAEMQQVKEKEGERILAQIKPETHVVALAIDGELWTSEKLAEQFDQWATYGKSSVAFIIGGSLGLSGKVLKRANQQISLSRMTFPHQLVRMILLEQIYRGFKINRGEPYHK
jgi:23S rRNA (pseudouridine1915-N3)-methyltransferase